MTALAIHHLAYTYPGAPAPAVAGIEMEIAPGEIVGLLGPSGAGKTTTLHVVTRLLEGWTGAIEVLGRPLRAWDGALYDRIGVAFELPSGYPTLTAREDLGHFAALHDVATRPVDELLEAVGLSESADLRLGAFSKGMRLRLNLARALLHRADLLVLDEPTSGLDPVTTRRIRAVVSAERDRGAAVLVTTHDMATAEALCDRVAFMAAGSIVACDTPAALRRDRAGGLIRVELARDGTVVEELVPLDRSDRLCELVSGGGVQRIETVEPDLAEVFAQVTGGLL
jgi:fluoroquinolone transport system ATP-binding protein